MCLTSYLPYFFKLHFGTFLKCNTILYSGFSPKLFSHFYTLIFTLSKDSYESSFFQAQFSYSFPFSGFKCFTIYRPHTGEEVHPKNIPWIPKHGITRGHCIFSFVPIYANFRPKFLQKPRICGKILNEMLRNQIFNLEKSKLQIQSHQITRTDFILYHSEFLFESHF